MAQVLREHGLDARRLTGGLDAWRAAIVRAADDQAMLGLAVYDALYVASRDATGETQGRNPDALRRAAAKLARSR